MDQQATTVNKEAYTNIKKNWNTIAKGYDENMHIYLLQGFNTLAIHAGV